MTQDEIRQVVQSLADAVNLLADASPEDRRQVYQAAQLEVLYDHQNRRAQLSVAPWVIGGVGGGLELTSPIRQQAAIGGSKRHTTATGDRPKRYLPLAAAPGRWLPLANH